MSRYAGQARATATAVACFAAATSFLAAPAHASSTYSLPANITIDKLGVEIGSLIYERRDTLMSIGDPAAGGLSWTYIPGSGSDSFDGSVTIAMSPATPVYETQIRIAGNLTVFIHCESGACQNFSGTPSSLVKTGSNWIYTEGDGTTYKFDDNGGTIDVFDPVAQIGRLLTITYPNGVVISLNYFGTSSTLQSVVSSGGYALKYASDHSVISVVNLANHTCDAIVSTCDAVDASVTFGSGGIIDPTGGVWQYTVLGIPTGDPLDQWFPHEGIRSFTSPDGYHVSTTYDAAGRITTFTDNRGTWTYSYPDQTVYQAQHGNTNHTINVTDPSGAILYTAEADMAEPFVDYVQDALGSKTQFGAVGNSYSDGTGVIDYLRLNSVTQPEGNSKSLTFDARWNVTAVTETPKTGSATAITASYPSTCTNIITCNKPTWTKDAALNETDYTYDPTHGGVLSEMQPAPTGGAARPLKLTTWVQKYPYYKNPSGTVVAGATPIWVISTVTECQTVAGSNSPVCDSAGPQRVTTYEYGANGTANNLMVHGISVTADGTTRRTCYGYDALGNKIWETKPRAGQASCS